MIYSHKPQRSGRSIPANTNNPPQDPPPPPKDIPKVSEIPIDTPPVPEPCIKVTTPKPQKKIVPKQQPTPKLSLFQKIFQKIKRFFRLG